MKIRLKFGYRDGHEENVTVDWNETNPKTFPSLSKYNDSYWSFIFYSDGFVSVDYEFILAETRPNMLPRDQFGNPLPVVDLNSLLNIKKTSVGPCECGARYTEFPEIHLPYCPQWRRK